MDCCSKYSQYRHHSLAGGIIGNGIGSNGINGGYYAHIHPSLRYQPSLYRLSGPGPGYNGFGLPSTNPTPPSSSMYQNYEHFPMYPNLSSYGYNGNGFNCGNVNARSVNGYYPHCDNFSRMGIGSSSFPYQTYRDLYDVHHNSRGSGYTNNMYSHTLPGREYHQNINNGYHQSLPGSYRHLHHSYLRSASKDALMSHTTPDIQEISHRNARRDECIPLHDSNMTSVHSPSSSSFASHGGNICTHNTSRTNFTNGNYSPFPNNETSSSGNRTEQQHHHQQQQQQQQSHIQQLSPSEVRGSPTDFISYSLRESKTRKSVNKDRDKSFNKQSAVNRRSDCSTPLDQSPILERSSTPFVVNTFQHSPVGNSHSRLQNGYPSSNQSSSSCWSPYLNSPSNWNQQQQYSPKSVRKRCSSPKLSPSPSVSSSIITNKNRVLECDFIPSKKSKRKIKSESSDDNCKIREEIKDITPLPGFQQAFGSTEIGRFSETFFSAIDSCLEPPYESEADTLSPQPWETGDSLDGPHYNLHVGASVQPVYSDNQNSIDSSIDSSYFSEIRCSDY